MNQKQLNLIPTDLLTSKSTTRLQEWLDAPGWRMSLLELDNERRARRRRGAIRTRETHVLADPARGRRG